jgi:organic hydroperoxide reductase OsmC/OhrA
MDRSHHYTTDLNWTGDTSVGYETYDRTHTIRIANKPELITTSDPLFRGDPALHNPEDLLLAALSSCHLLTYLALCARKRITVLSYRDQASGTLVLTPEGGGHFSEVLLRPEVIVASAGMVETARALHVLAHKYCFIANSVNFPVRNEAAVRTA